MEKKIIAANWKMNKTVKEAKQFFEELSSIELRSGNKVIICAPFTCLGDVVRASRKLKFLPGAQNMHPEKSGAFTGEISADMLAGAGVKVVIVGHSERRTLFAEKNEFIAQKVEAGLGAGLLVILCVGETLKERESNKTKAVLKKQLYGITPHANLVIAYEPVWAIGTGLVASSEQIAEAHAFIKSLVDVPVLYGGSVNEKNAREIFAVPNVDGGLIGGASLDAVKFAKLVNVE